jgi:uncharacterized protein (DUF1800 family)
VVVLLTIVASLMAGRIPLATADTKASASLTAEHEIIHLLNRIGYGPRPGDLERVKRVGLDKYIDQQVHPETIDDAATEARLGELESLRMTNAELAEKYPERGQVARCFTGWTIERPRREARFVFRAWMHDTGEKVVLGHKIPAGGGIKDGETVIEILVHHPSTARFISTKLVRRFVSDNPLPALVDRVAAVYTKTDGDIREMLRTIFTSTEFYALEVYRAKIKSPFELAASAIRALDGNTDGSPRLAQFVAKMGQALYQYQPPTGYPDRAEQWVNTGALLERLNFALALSTNHIPGTAVNPARATTGIDPTQRDRLMARAIDVLLYGDVSPQTRAVFDRQLREELPPVKGELNEDSGMHVGSYEATAGVSAPAVAKVVGLVLGSPEFQRR